MLVARMIRPTRVMRASSRAVESGPAWPPWRIDLNLNIRNSWLPRPTRGWT
jgi:hypothetical protein